MRRLEVTNGAGNLTLDLRGDRQRALAARIDGGVGEVTIYLPEDQGVGVNVDQGIGEVNTRGLSWDGDAYVNDIFGASEATLELDINAGIGKINLYAEGK